MTGAWLVVRPRRLPLSLRLDRRVPPALLGLGLALLAAIVANVGVGE